MLHCLYDQLRGNKAVFSMWCSLGGKRGVLYGERVIYKVLLFSFKTVRRADNVGISVTFAR